MRHEITILTGSARKPTAGYTPRIYAYSTGSPFYTGSALYTFTDHEDGTYSVDVTSTLKATIVITAANSTAIVVPANKIGILIIGDDYAGLAPGGSTP